MKYDDVIRSYEANVSPTEFRITLDSDDICFDEEHREHTIKEAQELLADWYREHISLKPRSANGC